MRCYQPDRMRLSLYKQQLSFLESLTLALVDDLDRGFGGAFRRNLTTLEDLVAASSGFYNFTPCDVMGIGLYY